MGLHRLMVRTSGFHPGNRGSIPLGVTSLVNLKMSKCLLRNGNTHPAQSGGGIYMSKFRVDYVSESAATTLERGGY